MHVVYYDESGDDGFPNFSSPLFVLSAIYAPAADWRENFDKLATCKRELAQSYNLPFKTELHTHELLRNKRPYHNLDLPEQDRIDIITAFCHCAASLSIKILTTAVIKPWIKARQYAVLDRALDYSITRISRDLSSDPSQRFIVITDEGRVGKMRTTTRRVQRINYTPSHFSTTPYRSDIFNMIEDPLPKDSRESYFIQLADLTARIYYLLLGLETSTVDIPNRYPHAVDKSQITAWLEILNPVINLHASKSHPYGLVRIPSAP